jgi:hypothetical protein
VWAIIGAILGVHDGRNRLLRRQTSRVKSSIFSFWKKMRA